MGGTLISPGLNKVLDIINKVSKQLRIEAPDPASLKRETWMLVSIAKIADRIEQIEDYCNHVIHTEIQRLGVLKPSIEHVEGMPHVFKVTVDTHYGFHDETGDIHGMGYPTAEEAKKALDAYVSELNALHNLIPSNNSPSGEQERTVSNAEEEKEKETSV